MKKFSLTITFLAAIAITTLATTRPAHAACPSTLEQGWIEADGTWGSCVLNAHVKDTTIGGTAVLEICCDPDYSNPVPPTKRATQTGLGIIGSTPQSLITDFLSLATKIAGGVALLLLVSGGIKIITTQGDPKAFDAAKGTITRALSGLLLVVLAVFIMKFIGYDILQLPGWKDSGGDLELPH